MGRLGFGEIVLIVLVIVLLFGAKKLPEIGRALGEAIKEFRKAGKELDDAVSKPADKNEKPS